jgi:hypothetical protein
MPEHLGTETTPSTVVWESLEKMIRKQMQGWLQDLPDEEVTAFLGRAKSRRRDLAAAAGRPTAAYRNGHGKPLSLTTPAGTITVYRPRVRGLAEQFTSRVLPLSAKRQGRRGLFCGSCVLKEGLGA